MSEKKSRGVGRTRSWTFVLYPESAPNNWRTIIDEEYIQWVESPLHDKDVDENGNLKKSHLHILLIYESVKNYEQVKEITEKLNATVPQKCHGAKGLVRYMIHMDNPEKFQYDKSKIVGHGGVDVAELLKPTATDRYILIAEMMDFVRDNNICQMNELIYYARTERFDDWFPLLCDNSAYIMSCLIRSNREERQMNSDNQKRKYIVNTETGEVIE